MTLTQERLRELFDYDDETGMFRRKAKIPGHRRGENAGGYVHGAYRIVVDGRSYRAEDLAVLYNHGWLPERQRRKRDTARAA